MEIKIMNENENALFKRKEILAEADTNTTPSNSEILKLLSEKYSVPENAIKIKGIYGKFGTNKFNIKANIYSSKEEKEKIEIKTKKEIEAEKKVLEAQKKTEEEAKVQAEAEQKPVGETPPETPSEEPAQEETKVEETKNE